MKAKCPKCGTGKARRNCAREGNAQICSECCASIRDADCGDCLHYAAARQYEASSRVSATLSDGHFMMEISDEVSHAVDKAMDMVELGKTQEALLLLTKLLPDHPIHPDIPYGIGVIHAIKGDHKESIKWFDRAISINPYSFESHYNKAVSYQKLNDFSNCIRSHQKVISVGPASDPSVRKSRELIDNLTARTLKDEGITLDAYLLSYEKFNEALDLMDRDDWQGALAGFRATAAINRINAPCHGNMGLCYARLGQKAEALAQLDLAIQINPDYQPAIINRVAVEKMTEGRPLEITQFQNVNYAQELLNARK